jgi:hypothetical protein
VKLRRNNAFTYAVEPTEKEAKQRLKPFANSLEILPREGRKCKKLRRSSVSRQISYRNPINHWIRWSCAEFSLRRRSAQGELI